MDPNLWNYFLIKNQSGKRHYARKSINNCQASAENTLSSSFQHFNELSFCAAAPQFFPRFIKDY